MLVSAVDVVYVDQLLDTFEVALLGGIQEGTVPTKEVSQVPLLVLHQVKAREVVSVTFVHICSMLKEQHHKATT